MVDNGFLTRPPASDEITPYDEAHFPTYLRLLDAEEENVSWQEAAEIIFGANIEADFESAKLMYDSHLARAKWLSSGEFSQLLYKKKPYTH